MNQVQFYDKKNRVRYLVFLPKKWTWETVDSIAHKQGLDSSNWDKSNEISLFDGDLQGNVGDIYVKVERHGLSD